MLSETKLELLAVLAFTGYGPNQSLRVKWGDETCEAYFYYNEGPRDAARRLRELAYAIEVHLAKTEGSAKG